MFIGIYTIANAVTLFGLISSITACFLAVNGNILFAVYMMFLACLCDMFDGTIARTERKYLARKNRNDPEFEKKLQIANYYGVQLDSLCDVISFGVTPCIIAFAAGFNAVLDVIIYCIFVVCGAIRLANYNTLNNKSTKDVGSFNTLTAKKPEKSKRKNAKQHDTEKGFFGVPIPMSTFAVTFLFMLNEFIPFGGMSWIVRIVFLCLAFAFIFNRFVKRPNIKNGMILLAIEVIMLLVLLIAHWSNADVPTDNTDNGDTSVTVSSDVTE